MFVENRVYSFGLLLQLAVTYHVGACVYLLLPTDQLTGIIFYVRVLLLVKYHIMDLLMMGKRLKQFLIYIRLGCCRDAADRVSRWETMIGLRF